jgi:hypothetical protein
VLTRLALLLLLAASAAKAPHAQERFVIPIAEDTLLYIDNRGATRILVELNGVPFKLATSAAEVAASPNAYLIPEQGTLTIDIAPYMGPGEDANVIEFIAQGPPGSDFEFVLAPVFVEGQTSVAYRLSGLRPLPEQFRLRAGPNPSSGPVTIRFEIPAARIAGVPVRLTVLDRLGRTVATLVDGVRYPGTFTARWDAEVASGVYLVRFETDSGGETVRVTRVR